VIGVLLGAGASKDAGLPTSTEMVDKLLQYFQASSQPKGMPQRQQLFEFVVHGLRQQAAGRGDPAAVDVETVFDAIENLGARSRLSIVPFVSAWHPLVVEAERTASAASQFGGPTYHLADLMREAIREESKPDTHRRSRGPSENFVRALLGLEEDAPMVFEQLAEEVLRALVSVLRLASEKEVEYLEPLVDLHRRQGGLHIATLNYDLTVETLGRFHNVQVDTGMSKWPEQQALSFAPNSIKLYKLHGSISWERVPKDRIGARGLLSFDRIKQMESGAEPSVLPSVIFGAGNKLVAGGPYLELLRSFEADLSNCQVLLVAGYSFRDDHVNAVITKWMNNDPSSWYPMPKRRLVVLDPNAAGWRQLNRTPPMPLELMRVADDQPKRFKVIAQGTRHGLREAIAAAQTEDWAPHWTPDA
jgi:SIR2-like domain